MIIVKTPLRISFFGGCTDFPYWYKKNNGKVISSSIDKYGYITIKKLSKISKYNFVIRYHKNEYQYNISQIKHKIVKEVLKRYNVKERLEISYSSDLPGLSGMGSSSAFTVGMIKGIRYFLKKNSLNNKKLLQEAINIEHKILKENSGSQDQTAAAYGGFNVINFNKNGIKVISQKKNFKILIKLNKLMTLVFTNIQRKSDKIEKEKIKNIDNKKQLYFGLYNIAKEAEKKIKSGKLNTINFIDLLNKNMLYKKQLSKNVLNKKISKMLNYGLKNGASAAKILGAGGGGFILFFSKSLHQKKKLENFFKNYKIIDFKFLKKNPNIKVFNN